MSLAREHHALLVEMHRLVQESSRAASRAIAKHMIATEYPPPGTKGAWTTRDSKAIAELTLSPAQERALRKLLADHAASVLFQCLSLIDGVSDPELTPVKNWMGLRLVVPTEDEDAEMLHDAFFDTYGSYLEAVRRD